MFPRLIRLFGVASAVALVAGIAYANEELNLYSSRHYDTDEKLYTDFEDATGIRINRIEGKADELIARMKAEGRNSPADILLTVDVGRIWRADQAGLLQRVDSDVLNARIPAHLRHPMNRWFGFSQRARIIFYAKDRVANPPRTYEALADPEFAGQVCIRSSSNIYNQSLLGAVIAHDGADGARQWAAGVVANFARPPQGGDTDQLRGIVSGECDIAVANTYYFLRGLNGDVDGLSAGIDGIGWVFPNQDSTGTHMNIAAAGVAAFAPNRDNAVRFLEYLASDAAQEYFANQNNEFPAVEGVAISPLRASLGTFRTDDINLAILGENQPLAQRIFNEAGWK